MSDDLAIKVEGLGKCYHIYDTPRDRLKQFILPRLQNMIGQRPKQYYREFWALRDVSFEVKKGETVAIIGRNGSGKSTLLQIICNTLNPTCGKVTTNGRIAALLELGSGFNPEFTGRENVYLNGTILGLSRSQIDAKYDSILRFADIGQFIDQPVKTYSSGMIVRLAFAVIAHVEADILLVDEALAVGDAVFTQKCMRFIRSFQQQGTLLFVSHDMSSVTSLCRRGIWLDRGRCEIDGEAKKVCQAYLQQTLQSVYGEEEKLHGLGVDATEERLAVAQIDVVNTASPTPADDASPILDYGGLFYVTDNLKSARGFRTGKAELVDIRIVNMTNPVERLLQGGERVQVRVRARALAALKRPILGFVFHDRLGQVLFGENTLPFTESTPCPVPAGRDFEGIFQFRLPMLPNGDYVVFASVAEGELHANVQHHLLHDALIVRVSSSKVRWGLVGVAFDKVELKVCE
jgi:lipopolysaccharide transport system ATP-binding protein